MGAMQTKQKLYNRTIKNGDCIEFIGAISKNGYGVVGFSGKVWQAHRLSYYFTYGEIPKEMMVCHTCDNRKCIRPSHLFLGTAKDNTQDMIDKGRMKARAKKNFCLAGHALVDNNLYFHDKSKSRQCKACSRLRKIKYYNQKKLNDTQSIDKS